MLCICSYIYFFVCWFQVVAIDRALSELVYFRYSGQNVNVAKRVVNFRSGLITLRISVRKYVLVPLLDRGWGCVAVFVAVKFSFCARWAKQRIFVNKNCKASTVFCFRLIKQKGSAVLILLALQSNSTSSVLTNDGTLGAEIRELKPGAAAPAS